MARLRVLLGDYDELSILLPPKSPHMRYRHQSILVATALLLARDF